jgi:hypothetical protein
LYLGLVLQIGLTSLLAWAVRGLLLRATGGLPFVSGFVVAVATAVVLFAQAALIGARDAAAPLRSVLLQSVINTAGDYLLVGPLRCGVALADRHQQALSDGHPVAHRLWQPLGVPDRLLYRHVRRHRDALRVGLAV